MKISTPVFITSCILLTIMSFADAQPQKSEEISISMDRVMLVDFIRIVSTSTGTSIHYSPEENVYRERVSLHVQNQPWPTVLRGLLFPFGYVLLENEPSPGAYTIAPAGDPMTAARIRSAQETNSVLQAVIEALDADDADKARELLEALHTANEKLIESASPPKPATP
ncbi:MAG: hypothetical protein JJU05_08150 [Verrucomicrobia bacterium]|nr:hypothetical protein [Verrucomicrobiota bacterium]MCH8526741.1 hypothetical protein [Kiritimatiellia bacterium]